MTTPDQRVAGLSAIVLAGGRSTRFGSDKASALIDGRPMLHRVVEAVAAVCDEVVVVAATGGAGSLPPYPLPLVVVEDRVQGSGPLAGLVEGMRVARGSLCFATSCDAPLLRPGLVRLLAGQIGEADICCPRVHGRLQPLAAVYRRATCLPVFERNLAEGRLPLLAAYDHLRVVEVDEAASRTVDPALDSFLNVNRPGDLEAVVARLRGRG
ncbi:MAG: molybdenum cofactor guanylyltransferase [Chloroflexi bacterium]|nr:molybdenum cofactor guanylyltransferase [Chloroflexota bacterium]